MRITEQAYRILNIYTRLVQRQTVNKSDLAERFDVNKRTIQRDIDNLRNYLFENGSWQTQILYDAKAESYYLNRPDLINPKNFRHYPKISVTFEMTLEVFDKLRPYYTSELIQHKAEDVVLVRMRIPEPNALSLVFIYHSRIRVIEPASLLQKVVDAMLEMQKTYLNQEIKTNSGGTT
ncbi:putative DNA binding protein [Staphylococcus piscifermentans]|uniref:Helix-turn-helix type 11 domain-containing protein n=1 Tax=Staphylococcus piscifermentans TaxID=70258 RepID=A0A239UIB0_9STAP|nr:HTH domain-containing protein [Staphylococcus piscifermentans]GEP85195.1 hypothetical protein SPI02_17800 [Staphylococcus piscifermentans]SNV09635.1 putative DNA binding protein [Staphylococcus piscifermentans]